MALSLGVKRGSKIRFSQKQILEVLEVKSAEEMVIDVDGTRFTITDKERTEVLPTVYVFCGRVTKGQAAQQQKYARIAIEAPRSIDIDRVH